MTNESYYNIITNELNVKITVAIEKVLQCFQKEVRSRSIQQRKRKIRNVNNLRTQSFKILSSFSLYFVYQISWIFFKFILLCELFCSMSVWLNERGCVLKLETIQEKQESLVRIMSFIYNIILSLFFIFYVLIIYLCLLILQIIS